MKILAFITSFVLSYSMVSQTPVVFVESSSNLNIREKYFGLAKAVVDLNGDFRDDILSIGQDSLLVEVQLNNGLIYKDLYTDEIQGNAYTVNVGDFDNDGFNDFLYSGFYNGVSLYHKTDDMFGFKKIQDNEEILFAQGSSVFDIDNDGWLDAIMSHDDGANITLMNDGTGRLLEEDVIDFRSIPVSDNSGNYSAIWVDLNQDDRQDLYISKCRVGVTDPEDPRRINTAFINTDTGFVESARTFQLDLGDQSWCADSGDLDNDGDIDIVVINHLSPHVLMENKGDGTFKKHESFVNIGPITTPDLEVSFADFNNDGLLDILISGTKDYLLLNQGGLQFKSNDNPFGFKNASSAAVGDLNNDGYLDCYISFGGPSTPSVIADETWINFGGSHNHFKLSLVGTESNRSGIGAQVLLYGPWGKQTRWQNSGVAYGITNSLNIHFGLADYQVIDSLIINWPGGTKDHYSNLSSNKHFIATEGVCIEEILNISYNALELDCMNDTIILSADSESDLFWLNGDSNAEIATTTPGYYQVKSSSDCINSSPVYEISQLIVPESPILNYADQISLCENDEIVLATKYKTNVLWSTGIISDDILIENEGLYFASNFNRCDTINSDTLRVEFLNQDYENETILLDSIQDYLLVQPGENINWFRDIDGNELISQGNEILIQDISSDTTVYFQNLATQDIPSFMGGAIIDDYLEFFGSDQANGGLFFEVARGVRILSFKTIAEIEGERQFIIQDNETNDTIYNFNVFMNKGVNRIEIDLVLEVGSYYISTDQEVNEINLGSISPKLLLADADVNYPYQIDQFVNIVNSNFGAGLYFYFFDWEIKAHLEPCYSEIISVEFLLDTITNNSHITEKINHLSVFPNPTADILNIYTKRNYFGWINVFDTTGKKMFSEKCSMNSGEKFIVNIESLKSGIYILQFLSGEEVYLIHFVKI